LDRRNGNGGNVCKEEKENTGGERVLILTRYGRKKNNKGLTKESSRKGEG